MHHERGNGCLMQLATGKRPALQREKVKQKTQQLQWFSGLAKGVGCFIPNTPELLWRAPNCKHSGHIKELLTCSPQSFHCSLDTTPPCTLKSSASKWHDRRDPGQSSSKGNQKKAVGSTLLCSWNNELHMQPIYVSQTAGWVPCGWCMPQFYSIPRIHLALLWEHSSLLQRFYLRNTKDTIPITSGLLL